MHFLIQQVQAGAWDCISSKLPGNADASDPFLTPRVARCLKTLAPSVLLACGDSEAQRARSPALPAHLLPAAVTGRCPASWHVPPILLFPCCHPQSQPCKEIIDDAHCLLFLCLPSFPQRSRVYVLSCPVVSDSLWPVDCSPPGSSVHGVRQARILEWVAMPSSRESSQPRDRTQVSCIAGGFFIIWASREAHQWSYINSIIRKNMNKFIF